MDQNVIQAVSDRFGIPIEAVTEIITTDPEILVLRSLDDERIPNNGTSPTACTRYPIGSVRISPYGGSIENRYIDFLHIFDPEKLSTSEAEQGIKQHPTYARYLQWAKKGIKPPYISVYETDSGKLQSTNRRRTLVAQELNTPIEGWFGRVNRETKLPLKYGDVINALKQECALLALKTTQNKIEAPSP